MDILIGCESSGTLREAMSANGEHYVMSADLLDTSVPGHHYKGDVFDAVKLRKWDMAIFFPPCTYLCNAQLWKCQRDSQRMERQKAAIAFVNRLMSLDIPQIAIENPIGILSTAIRRPDQIIRPWWFGDPYRKDLCLWLKNLPPLIATCYSSERKSIYNHTNSRMSQEQKSMIRSSWKYYPRTAKAIANQWA